MKKALVVGLGGIGRVYTKQLRNMGFNVSTVDPVYAREAKATYSTVNDVPKDIEFDIAIICCPNVHHLNAVLELTDVCKVILVEKPGLANTAAWNNVVHRFPNHRILLVKNNLYRASIDKYADLVDLKDVAKIDINWLNKDRIPNPGGWFTDSKQAFGGVTHDLFPHLYCYMFALIPFHLFLHILPKTFKMQRWHLDNIGDNTDYGKINKDGVYDVCDYAEAHYMIPRDNDEPLPVTLRASWKEGYDDQAIHVYFKNGSTLNLEFGLCPDEAYGKMIENVLDDKFMGEERQTWIEQNFDKWIHAQLEMFNYEN